MWNLVKERIHYFRKRYFGLRLLILLILFFCFFPGPDIIRSLVNIAIDAIFMAGVRTVSLSRGYRQLEIAKLETQLLQAFDQDENGELNSQEQDHFQEGTGFSLVKVGSSPRIKANEREIVLLAKKLGYETESYKQISLDCLRRAKEEEKELYGECMFYLEKGSFRSNFKAKRYLEWKTWERGLGKFLGNIYWVVRGPFYRIRFYKRYYSRDAERFHLFKKYLRDIRRGIIIIHKEEGEPGYKID